MEISSDYAVPKAEVKKVYDTSSEGLSGLANMGDFLKLFVAQLSHQDPLNPSDSNEFFAQTAQITMVEQMTKMNDNSKTSQESLDSLGRTLASTYLGKQVTAMVPGEDGDVPIEGVITDVLYDKDGKPMFGLASGELLTMAEIRHVTYYMPPADTTTADTTGNTTTE